MVNTVWRRAAHMQAILRLLQHTVISLALMYGVYVVNIDWLIDWLIDFIHNENNLPNIIH